MKYVFSFILFSILAFSLKAQWIELDTGMENPPVFNDVYAITPDIVVVVGNNGTILKTTDGGETWVQKPSGTTNVLSKVQFPTSEIGYVLGSGGTLLKTTNGGETWMSIEVSEGLGFYSLSCVNENLIFISSTNGLIKSEDGGEGWSEPTSIPYYKDIQFVNNDVGFIGNDYWSNFENAFAKTNDGGASWQEANALAPFYFLNENIGFYYFDGLYKTIDGGNQFDLVTDYEGMPELSDVLAINENTVWGLLYWETLDYANPFRGIIKFSASDSNNYSITTSLENIPGLQLNSIHFANETTGYVVGRVREEDNYEGTIWKNGTGINTMNTLEQISDNEIKVYPNPASKEINIEFENRNKYSVSLTDFSGKQIYSHSFNTNKIKINTEQFSKGIYILSVKSKEKNYTQKIIIN